MTKKLSAQITLNLTESMYASLLLESGGISKEIPNLIREKLEASYLSKNDAKRLLAQQELAVNLLIEIIRGQVLPITISAAQLDSAEAKKKESLKGVFEEQMKKQIDKIMRFREEAGL